MSNNDHDRELYDYDDDERFYEDTVYNEEYYIERERELIRQSNLELELEGLEERHIREIGEKGLPRLNLIKPDENKPEDDAPAPVDYPHDPGELPF